MDKERIAKQALQ